MAARTPSAMMRAIRLMRICEAENTCATAVADWFCSALASMPCVCLASPVRGFEFGVKLGKFRAQCRIGRRFQLRAHFANAIHQIALFIPARAKGRNFAFGFGFQRRDLRQTFGMIRA